MKYLTKIYLTVFLIFGLFTLQNCDSTKNLANTEIASKLKGTWVLKSMDNTNVSDLFGGKMPILTFEDQKISGNAGCNQYNGTYTLIGNKFIPSPFNTTRMACPQMDQENKFLENLGKTSTLNFNNYTLQFVQNNKVVLEFTPKAR